MEQLRDWSLCLDSPSKQSYVGSFYKPPEKLSQQLRATTAVPGRPDKAIKPANPKKITPPAFQPVPEAGSRAVLGALKTLQEKMRRLELERRQAERNVEQFSQAAHQYSSSTSHSEQQLGSREKGVQREELVSQLHSAESRCSLLEKQLDYMRRMVESAERGKITSVNKDESVQQNEKSQTDVRFQEQLQKLERLEKECHKLTSTQSEAERKIELLERKLLEEEHERKLVQQKAEEIERELEANLISLSAVETKPKKKSKAKALSKKPEKTVVPVSRCLPKAKCVPFVAGKSTSPSHSVNANIQSVLHLMKTRQPRLCEKFLTLQSRTESRRSLRQAPSSGDRAATLGSLSELLLALQDELGQMSFEHQELVRQIDETDQRKLRDDLERELDCLVGRMEEKAAQISKLRKHQQALSQGSPKQNPRPRRAASADGRNLAAVVHGVPASTPSPGKASSSRTQKHHRVSQERLQLLRDTQKLRSSLRQQDITWEA